MSGGRITGLDGLRAIAVIAVIAYHTWPDAVPGGAFGVHMFFVLSGFLITILLLAELERHDRVDLVRFYLRRVLRLFPALYAMLVVTVTTYVVLAPQWVGLRTVFATATYTGNWWRAIGQGLGPLGHTWSLATEEQFYLMWPVVLVAVAALARRGRVHVRLGITAGVMGLLSTTVAMVESIAGASDWWLGNAFGTVSMPLWVGCAIGCWWYGGGRLPRLWVGWPAAGVIVVWILGGPEAATTPGWLLAQAGVVVATGVVIVAAGQGVGSRFLETAAVARLGVISYGMYLWHFPIVFLPMIAGWQSPTLMVTGLVITYIVAEASYRWLETPFLRIKAQRGYPDAKRSGSTMDVEAVVDNRHGPQTADHAHRRKPDPSGSQ